jgi:CDP-diacylglycerol--glycerol-3-phosphate 3-phosphatidyltransferase
VETSPARPARAAWVGYLPHALSLLRVAFVIVTYGAAIKRDAPLFAILVLLAVLTDILDGPLARHLGTASRFGANVDSAADLLFYASLPIWAWLFRPDLVLAYLPLILTFGILYVAANFTSQKVFGALGVHNRLSRTSGTVGVVVTFYGILWGPNVWLFVLAFVVLSADLAQRYAAILRHMRAQRQVT